MDLLGLFGVLKYILAGRKAQAAPTVVARKEAILKMCVNHVCSSGIANATCQKNHWSTHEKYCKQRVTELTRRGAVQ